MTSTRKPKFVLVDPSFVGKNGDKWQYALAFQDSARRNGYEFILLGNVNSPDVAAFTGVPIDQRNVFRHQFYEHGQVMRRIFDGPLRKRLASLDARTNARAAALDTEIERQHTAGAHVEAERLAKQRRELLSEHIEQTESLIAEIEREEPLPRPFNRDDFAEVLAEQLKSLSLTNGDVLFVHTTTQAMLESLNEISVHLEGDETLDIDAHFLFHFGAEAPDARTFIDRYYSYSHFDSLKLRLTTGSPFRRLHLSATSEILRDELEGFFGLPVGIFEGLCNPDRYFAAVGGEAAFDALRAKVVGEIGRGRVSIGVRVADLDDERFAELLAAADALEGAEIAATIRLACHDRNRSKAARFAAKAGGRFVLVDTSSNEDYIRFLVDSAIVLLPYRDDVYKKRVSAVLHDCAVMGISSVVPKKTTLGEARDFADIYVYGEVSELAAGVVRAATALIADPSRSAARREQAVSRFGSDVISRLLRATGEPSLTVARRGPVATVVMPMWGRVGSSVIFDSQIQFLLEQGYFVVQVLSYDKIANLLADSDHFWRTLFEVSQKMRGNVLRVALREEDHSGADLPRTATGYDLYEANFGLNSLQDERLTALTRRSAVTLVNHVFNSALARAIGGGTFILETHDIQSVPMSAWPLLNPFTGKPETFDALFESEIRAVSGYDYVVNLSTVEHEQLQYANAASRVITPYVAVERRKPQFESISAMSHAYGWHESYRGLFKFDLLLLGDAHPANVESGAWFLDKVYRPHLQARGFRLGIAGRLSERLYEMFDGIANVFYCGFVDDIFSLRYLSDVVILPDRRGSGISIKLLETLAYGNAFVATPVAFRGIADLLDEPPPAHDEPFEFAERVTELIESSSERTALADWANRAYQRLASRDSYDAAWADVFRTLHLPLSET
jgi:glycosyltransferase involved in cell wall biosynthesis